MNSGIDKLKELGAQKIYEQTHVSKEHVQAILHNSFEGLNKVQIIGFISILEREYTVDLADTRTSANSYFDQLSTDDENSNKEIFVAVREKKSNNTPLYISIIVVILAIALYFSLKDSIKVEEKVDNRLIDNVKEKIVQEENTTKAIVKTDDVNISKVKTDEVVQKIAPKVVKEEKKPEKKIVKSLKILPKTKVWLGYIDMSNNKHHQIVIRKSLELNASKDWLFLFGHNQVEFKVDNKLQKQDSSIRYAYINSELKAITLKEFKKLNKGSKW